ncbi:MAG TPA: ribonuclease Y [Methylomirabilota bacterium]|nr:ribonuclease Y [Methylomirabilota bacterium]
MQIVVDVLSFLAGVFTCYFVLERLAKKRRLQVEESARRIREQAEQDREHILREANIAANEEALKARQTLEKAMAAKREDISALELRVSQREALINQQLEALIDRERQLGERTAALEQQRAALEEERVELHRLAEAQKQALQKVSGLTEAEARTQLLREVERAAIKDAGDLTRHILEEAKLRTEDQARRIIGIAIQRYAASHVSETTTATVALPSDEMKGRIIGREGRNIRAFENATGMTVLIDDTPNAVVLSGFDPVRREVAREAMQRLIIDGRIHPTRIEEVVGSVKAEIEDTIVKAAEEAVYKLGLAPLPIEVLKKLGALKFRHSFSQNILAHSIEVSYLTGLLAAELGVDVTLAKKAGLLHDIGKALDHEMEGAHALIGADFIRAHGECEEVIIGVASHHNETPPNIFGTLVSAADAMSASRPGARAETMTTYIKRLANLEEIGMSFEGVEKCFAVQAGRELRVIVKPQEVNDEQAAALARNVARRIEDELQYPGQIRVTVVRETRCTEHAK